MGWAGTRLPGAAGDAGLAPEPGHAVEPYDQRRRVVLRRRASPLLAYSCSRDSPLGLQL